MTVQLPDPNTTGLPRRQLRPWRWSGDKWTVLIVVLLGDGPKRFNEIKRMVGRHLPEDAHLHLARPGGGTGLVDADRLSDDAAAGGLRADQARQYPVEGGRAAELLGTRTMWSRSSTSRERFRPEEEVGGSASESSGARASRLAHEPERAGRSRSRRNKIVQAVASGAGVCGG